MHQVRGRVIQADRLAPIRIDDGVQVITDRKGTLFDRAEVDDRIAALLRVDNRERVIARGQHARVTDLPAALGVERRR